MSISRGDIWDVNFDPQVGDEIRKIRPAVVMDRGSARLQIRIVVPVTGWHPNFTNDISKVGLPASPETGLSKPSAADAYQVKSLSISRFLKKRGKVSPALADDIALAVATLIDAPLN